MKRRIAVLIIITAMLFGCLLLTILAEEPTYADFEAAETVSKSKPDTRFGPTHALKATQSLMQATSGNGSEATISERSSATAV